MPTPPQDTDMLADFVKAIEVANARFGAQVGAECALGNAEDLYTLASYAHTEMRERFTTWDVIMNFNDSEPKGMYAVRHLLMLKMLLAAPSVLPLCVERAYRNIHAKILGTD